MRTSIGLLTLASLVSLSIAGCGDDSGSGSPDMSMAVAPDLAEPMDSTEQLDDNVVPCDHPEYWPFHVDSDKHPLTVNYRKKDEEEVAREALGYLETSWDVEIGTLGFRPPLDDSGLCGHNGNTDLFLWRDHDVGAIGASYTDALGNPKGGIEAYPAFMVIDAWGVQGGSILDATIAHEFNHTLQAADDWYDSTPVFEACAQFIEDQVFDDDNEYKNILYDFQGNPDWSIDRDDNYDSWFMYGGAMYFFYLRDAHFGGDAKYISEMWKRMRNPVDATDPDYQDALDSMLQEKSSSFLDSVVGFQRWRWYTNNRDDGKHFEEGASWPASAKVKIAQTATIATARVDLNPQPMLLGAGYVELSRSGADPATIKIALDAPANAKVRWVVQAVPGTSPSSDGDTLDFTGGPVTVPFVNDKRTIIVTALPTGAYDPDDRDDTRYPVALLLTN